MKKKRNRYTKEEVEKIISLRKGGLTYDEILKRLNRGSIPNIAKVCKKAGLVNINQNLYSHEDDLMIVKMKSAGSKWNDIAKSVNHSYESVKSHFKQLKKAGKLEALMSELNDKTKAETVVENEPVTKDEQVEYKMETPENKYTLDDFSPREMFKHLGKKGYKIKGNNLVRTVEVVVDLKKIIGE